MEAMISAGVLAAIGVIHSVLGEKGVLGPLFAAKWETEEIPRWALERILRFAWHLTTLAWWCLGGAAIGMSALDALAICALGSGAIIFVMLRGHLAWPLFGISGAAALMAAGRIGWAELSMTGWVAIAIALAAAAFHVYWAAGGRAGLAGAAPGDMGSQPMTTPWRVAAMAVALALVTFGGLLYAGLAGVGGAPVRWLLGAAVVVLGLRVVGDGRYVGLTKTERGSVFARRDDALYTPLVFALVVGALSVAMAA